MSRFIAKELKPIYKEIDTARKELNRIIDMLPDVRSGIPETHIRINGVMQQIDDLLQQFSNAHNDAIWRYNRNALP